MKKDMKTELEYLKNVKRKEVREKINNARKFCDFNEDSTYKDFIEEQYRLEDKIKEIETKLNTYSDDKLTEYSLLNHKITIKWVVDNLEETYYLVSPIEANIKNNYLSVESPLGKALAHAELEKKLKVNLPNGEEEVEILKIESINRM